MEESVEIPLTQGKSAVVDAIDADVALDGWFAVSHFRTWYALRRRRRAGGGQEAVRLHRVIWEKAHPGEHAELVDHIDGDGLNCRRSNLRSAAKKDNARNARLRLDNSCGFKGVHAHVTNRVRWRAQIRVDGKLHHLGLFETAEAAAYAYDIATQEHFGDFVALNFPTGGQRPAKMGP